MKLCFTLFFVILIFLSSCANENSHKELDYDQTKKMVVDILQTDEGKKTVRDLINDDKMKQLLIMDSDDIKNAVTNTLNSNESKKMWKELFEDPEFATSFSETFGDEQQNLFKHLMNDATFQKQMIDLLKNPEMTEQNLQLLKSQQFREHLEEVILETLNSTIFQEKIQKALQKSGGDNKGGDSEKQKEDENGGGEKDSENENEGDEGNLG